MNGFRLSAILLVMSAVVAIAPSAYANPCLNSAKKITVLLELPNTKGSGVLISRVRDGNRYTYKVLTAYHVVEGIARNNKEGYVNLGDKQRYQLVSSRPIKQLENLGKKLDLAIVDFSSEREYEVAKVVDSRNLPESSNLYVAGFPLPSDAIPESTFRCKGGVLENVLSIFNDGYQLVYDNSTLAGMSGGAVLNENAELVGIHGRTELANNGKGRNLGIPSALFISLLNLNESGTSNSSSSASPIKTTRNTSADSQPISQTQAMKAQDYLARGVDKAELGDKQGAIADFSSAIRFKPNDADAYYNRGLAKYELGEKQGAINDYNEAIRLKPDDADAYYGRGVVKSALGEKQGAITDYNKAIRLKPDDADAYYGRGVVKSALGEKQGAITDYNKAIRLKPNYADAYYGRGVVKSALGEKQGAITDYNPHSARNGR
jgi:Flp pilus assembly protein TadD